jgi:uncharacterized membrane protein
MTRNRGTDQIGRSLAVAGTEPFIAMKKGRKALALLPSAYDRIKSY